MAQLAETEVSNEEILNMELNMSIDELLEITLCEMRNHTKLLKRTGKGNWENGKKTLNNVLKNFKTM